MGVASLAWLIRPMASLAACLLQRTSAVSGRPTPMSAPKRSTQLEQKIPPARVDTSMPNWVHPLLGFLKQGFHCGRQPLRCQHNEPLSGTRHRHV